jgi:hypothetical protein
MLAPMLEAGSDEVGVVTGLLLALAVLQLLHTASGSNIEVSLSNFDSINRMLAYLERKAATGR